MAVRQSIRHLSVCCCGASASRWPCKDGRRRCARCKDEWDRQRRRTNPSRSKRARCADCGTPCRAERCHRCSARLHGHYGQPCACGEPLPRDSKGRPLYHIAKEGVCQECRDRARVARRAAAAARQSRPPSARAPRPAITRVCAWCGVSFTTKAPVQKYCCHSHQNVAKSQRRKTLMRSLGGNLPTVGDVYVRDKGRCWICGKRVS